MDLNNTRIMTNIIPMDTALTVLKISICNINQICGQRSFTNQHSGLIIFVQNLIQCLNLGIDFIQMLPYIQSLQEAADIYHFSAYWIRTRNHIRQNDGPTRESSPSAHLIPSTLSISFIILLTSVEDTELSTRESCALYSYRNLLLTFHLQ